MKISVTQKIHLGFLLALLTFVGIAWTSYRAARDAASTSERVIRTQTVLRNIKELRALIIEIETGQRGYILTGREAYLGPFTRAAQTTIPNLRKLRRLTAGDPFQQQRFDRLEAFVLQRLAIARESVKLRRTAGFEAARGLVLAGDGREFMERILGIFREMESHEQNLLEERHRVSIRLSRGTMWIVGSGSAFGFGTIVLAMFFLDRDVRARERAEDALRRAHEDLEHRVQARTESLREANERLHALVESSPLSILSVNASGNVMTWNAGAERMFGWKADEAIGDFPPFVPEKKWSEFQQLLERALAGETITGVEVVRRRKNGTAIDVNLSLAPLRDAEGAIAGVMAVMIDVTDRKRIEEEIRALNRELEQRVQMRTAELESINAELEAFTYSVSHDLRAPLRHIDGFSRILTEELGEQLEPKYHGYFRRIQEATRQMGRLIDDLLNLARVGRSALSLQKINLELLAKQTVNELQAEAEGRSIEWIIGPLPVISGDPGLLKVVFANLLGNAIKFTRPRDKAVIEVGQEVHEGVTVVYVRDNGVGFNPKYADKLFGVFQRLHRQEDFEGTGVGLATVQRIIHKHGGWVWAEAEPDRGATFYFTIGERK